MLLLLFFVVVVVFGVVVSVVVVVVVVVVLFPFIQVIRIGAKTNYVRVKDCVVRGVCL